MDYTQFFNFLGVFNTKIKNNKFKNIYNETYCKDILNYNEFIEMFNYLIKYYNNHINVYNINNYIDLFHNNEMINDINEFVKKFSIDKIILLNDIFNFLMLDDEIYDEYILLLISYFTFNDKDIIKIKKTNLYKYIENIFRDKILPYIYNYAYINKNYDFNDYIYENYRLIEEDIEEDKNENSYRNIKFILNLSKEEYNLLNKIKDDNNDNNNKNYENYKYYKYNTKLSYKENLINQYLYHFKQENIPKLLNNDFFILYDILKKYRNLQNEQKFINNNKEIFISVTFYNFIQSLTNEMLIALNLFNPLSFSNIKNKDKISDYIFIAGMCNNLELVKKIVFFYNIVNKPYYPHEFKSLPDNIYNYLIASGAIYKERYSHGLFGLYSFGGYYI